MTPEWPPPPTLQLRVVEGSDTVVPLERKRRIRLPRLPRLPRRRPHAPDVNWTLAARAAGLFAVVFVLLAVVVGGLHSFVAML